MEGNIDRTPRYAPESAYVWDKTGNIIVALATGWRIHQPHKHPKGCPIIQGTTALEIITPHGKAWWGFEKAWINSELRIVVSGFPAHDEIRSKWEIVPTERTH